MWDPTSSEFDEKEATTINYRGEVFTREAKSRGGFVINLVVTCVDAAEITYDENFGLALKN